MNFLIDGYNLLYAVGLASPLMGLPRLRQARTRLLDWIAEHSRSRAAFHVIFDAQNGPGPSPESVHKGIRVTFAYKKTADDVIELMLAKTAGPGRLIVVSNDTRLHEAARRARAVYWRSEPFTDWLTGPDAPPTPHDPPSPEKPERPGAAEVAELLPVFDIKPKRRS